MGKEFAKCGEIVKVRTYQSGYGFIYYKDNAAAKKAVTTMDQQTLAKPFPEKRVVSVRYSIRLGGVREEPELPGHLARDDQAGVQAVRRGQGGRAQAAHRRQEGQAELSV